LRRGHESGKSYREKDKQKKEPRRGNQSSLFFTRRTLMNNCKMSLLITLFKVIVNTKNHYAAPSVNSILGLLEKHHHVEVRRRWLFQCLRDLEDAGYITRRIRRVKQGDGAILQVPSLWAFSLKGAQYLFKKCVAGAGDLMHKMLTWLNKGDSRWPETPKLSLPPTDVRGQEGMFHIGKILASLG
jgi:hypothetical protein